MGLGLILGQAAKILQATVRPKNKKKNLKPANIRDWVPWETNSELKVLVLLY